MAAPTIDVRPLAVRVYDEISSGIISGEIKAGAALVQEQVAAQYGVSRTPVRDALTQLTLEGMATLIPGRGYVVNDLSVQDVRDVYEVRYALEEMAIRQAFGHYSPQLLARLDGMINEYQVLDPSNAAELFRMSRVFHATLVEPCPNQYLLSTLAGVWDHPIQRRITMTYELGSGYQQRVADDHHRIVEAIRTDDLDTTIDVLRYCHDPRDTKLGSAG